MEKVIVRDLAKKFMWTIVTGDSNSLNRPLTLADTNRPGLELAGYFPDTQTKRLVVLGDKEIGYIEEQMDEISQRRSFEFLTGDNTPCIVIAHGHECPPVLKEIAKRKNFPVFKTEHQTSHAIVSITNYLDECLAESVVIHGELVRVFGVGVLITGKSGMGKSEIALELIKRGHQLVGDDRIDCYKIHDDLVGRTTPMLVGIEEKEYNEILGIKILKMTIPVSQGRPMSSVIETAVTNFLLLKDGLDSAKEFEERVLSQISENKKEEFDASVSEH